MRKSMDMYLSTTLDKDMRPLPELGQRMSTEANDYTVQGAINRVLSGLNNLPQLMETQALMAGGQGVSMPTDDSIDELDDLIGVVSSYTREPRTRDIANKIIQHAKSLQARLSEEEVLNNVVRPLASQT